MAKSQPRRFQQYSEILRDYELSIRQKAKHVSFLLREIGGYECPLDVLALIMGRNFSFCCRQAKVVEDVMMSINESDDALIDSSGFTPPELIDFLVGCKVIVVSLRLIAVQIKYFDIYEKGLEMKLDTESKDCLMKTRVGCLVIISHVLANASLTPVLKEQFSNPNIIQTLYSCMENDSSGIIVGGALILLKNVIYHYKHNKFFDKFISHFNILKIGRLMHKDILSNQMINWVNKGLTKAEFSLMTTVKEDVKGETLDVALPLKESPIPEQDLVRKLAIQWSCRSFLQCGFIIFQLISPDIPGGKQFAKILAEDPFCLEGFVKWINVPIYLSADLTRVTMALRLLGFLISDNENVAKLLIKKYNIEKCLERGVCHPHLDLAQHYIICVGNLASNSVSISHQFAENKQIIQAIIRSCFSPRRTLQEVAICTLTKLTDRYTTPKIIDAGFTQKEILKLQYFYDLRPDFHFFSKLRHDMQKYCNGLWKRDDNDLKEEIQTLTHKGIAKYKEKGNEFYKDGNYEEAIKYYTMGLARCAPSKSRATFCENDGSIIIELQLKDEDESGWYATPAALYSNRAQCYIYLKQYETAITDCNWAILLCDIEQSEGKKLLLKSAMRRSTAYFELNRCGEALTDIGICLIDDPRNSVYNVHFTKVLSKYYQLLGSTNLVQRCTFCLEGEGDKLKRCAQCEEHYCSRRCQVEAWKVCHKQLCKKFSAAKA